MIAISSKVLVIIKLNKKKTGKIKQNDMYMLAVIICLIFCLLADIIFDIYNAISKTKDLCWCQDWQYLSDIFATLPAVCLSVAILVNLRNWVYYYIKIEEASSVIMMNKEIRDDKEK